MLRMSSVDFVAHQNDAVLLSNLCLHRGRIVGFIAGQGLVHELAPMFAEHAFDAADHLAVERVIQQVVLPVAEHDDIFRLQLFGFAVVLARDIAELFRDLQHSLGCFRRDAAAARERPGCRRS